MDFPLVSKHIVKSRNPLSTVDTLSSFMKSFHCNSVFDPPLYHCSLSCTYNFCSQLVTER